MTSESRMAFLGLAVVVGGRPTAKRKMAGWRKSRRMVLPVRWLAVFVEGVRDVREEGGQRGAGRTKFSSERGQPVSQGAEKDRYHLRRCGLTRLQDADSSSRGGKWRAAHPGVMRLVPRDSFHGMAGRSMPEDVWRGRALPLAGISKFSIGLVGNHSVDNCSL